MPEGSNIMSASDLMLTFLSHTSADDVKYIGGLNPFTIKVDGEEVFIYIKNLSPAQLSNNNPDVWRIQLPVRDDFEKIKESASPFFLLGYDKGNDVYTTWNPYWCKQRLNVGKSVSLYSRLSLQQRVNESGEIEQLPLNNDGDVVCLPGNKIYEYIKNFKTYYPEETLFVARNSSIQARLREVKTPDELYTAFIDIDANANGYQKFLEDAGKMKSTVCNYLNALKYAAQNGILEKYRNLFANCANYGQYIAPMKALVAMDEIKTKDESWHGAIRAALNRYLEYWQGKVENEPVQTTLFDNIETLSTQRLFELDDFGRLIAVDETLYKQLQPFTKIDYPDYEEMIKVSEAFYPQEVTTKMTPVDWIKLFENLKKVKKNKARKVQSTKEGNEASIDKTGKQSRKSKTLRITFPNGTVLYNRSATKTYKDIIENNYPDLIEEIDFGYPVIAKEKMPDFKTSKRAQEQLFNGYWLSTNFSTETKADILKRISVELGLELDISIVDKE